MTKHTSRLQIATLMILMALAATCVSQIVEKGAGAKMANEISYVRAISFAGAHLKKLIKKSLPLLEPKTYLAQDSRGWRYWKVYSSDYRLDIDAKDGPLLRFLNNARMWQQYKGSRRTGRTLYSTRLAWEGHLQRLGRICGVPKDSKLVRFTWKKDGSVKDANSAGYVSVFFANKAGKEIAVINCDPQDGELMMFSWERRD